MHRRGNNFEINRYIIVRFLEELIEWKGNSTHCIVAILDVFISIECQIDTKAISEELIREKR